MNPGPELDALVAEKVMGWRDDVALLPPSYSTDIKAAWEVVEKMGSNFIIASEKRGEFAVFFGPGEIDEFCKSSSSPHAICLAALKAVGYEIEVNA